MNAETATQRDNLLTYFSLYPRDFATPYRRKVNSVDEVMRLMKYYNLLPLYVSYNSILDNDTIYVEQTVIDFDNRDKVDLNSGLKVALLELRKIVKKFQDYRHLIDFSGNGFHFFLKFKPRKVSFNYWAPRMKMFQQNIINEMHLQCPDLIVSEPKHLIRIPFTRYISNKEHSKHLNNRFVIPLDDTIVLNSSVEDIIKMSISKDFSHVQNQDAEYFDIDFVNDYKIEEVPVFKTDVNQHGLGIDVSILTEEDFQIYIEEMLDARLIKQFETGNPDHLHRFLAGKKLVEHGLNFQEAFEFYCRLEQHYKVIDYNPKMIYEQLKSIYKR